MPQSIDIDDEVLEILKRNAEPFVDTPNTVLRRLLNVDRSKNSSTLAARTHADGKGRAASGALLPERKYEAPILRYLDERGGRAPSREVIEAVGEALAGELTELDKRPLQSGGIRWQKRAAFVRLRLVERGELVRDSPRGTWEISDKGRERLRS
jgi:Mrr N-terminal domain